MILKFSADWCQPCKQLSKTLDTVGIFYKDIDIEKEPELTAKYRIRGVPTLICEVDGVGGRLQSRFSSLVEQFCNVGSGFILSLVLWTFVIVPVYDIEVSMSSNFQITAVFTVVSIVRGYLWRRLFNRIGVKQ